MYENKTQIKKITCKKKIIGIHPVHNMATLGKTFVIGNEHFIFYVVTMRDLLFTVASFLVADPDHDY